jgi:hypothetical protein
MRGEESVDTRCPRQSVEDVVSEPTTDGRSACRIAVHDRGVRLSVRIATVRTMPSGRLASCLEGGVPEVVGLPRIPRA